MAPEDDDKRKAERAKKILYVAMAIGIVLPLALFLLIYLAGK